MSTQRLAVTTLILDWRTDGIYVLAVTRKTNCEQWCLPGGKVEGEETLAEAAKRELEEETGVHVDAMRHLMPLYTAMDSGNYLCTTFMTTTRDMPDDLQLRPEPGTQVAWIPLAYLMARSPYTDYYEKMFAQVGLPFDANTPSDDRPPPPGWHFGMGGRSECFRDDKHGMDIGGDGVSLDRAWEIHNSR